MSPPSTARSPIHGRPPLGWGGLGGNNGWIAAHTSSGTNCSAMLNGAADDALFVMLHNYTPSRCETSSYNICCDLGLVAQTLAAGGLEAVERLQVRPGNPVRAMLAQRLSDAKEILAKLGGQCAAEYKYDGVRVQAH